MLYKMKFPITRQEIIGIDYNREARERRINEMMKKLCERFETFHINTYNRLSKPTQFQYRDGPEMYRHTYLSSDKIDVQKLYDEFYQKIRETFLDCKIIVDPLQTYVIIDWS